MVIVLVLAAALSRPYHVETIDSLAASRHTHVQVVGVVTFVAREADGDIHFRIADAHGHFVVCEIIPTLKPATPFARPAIGQRVTVRGIHRTDREPGHVWEEIHPVESWRPTP